MRSLLWVTAKRLATDPRVQRMAMDAAARARPRVEEAVRQLRAAAREASPLDDPGLFARKLRDRMRKKP